MKKALMVIGLAMCTTAAFAQIQKLSKENQKVNLNARAAVNVDYKASIFTKANGDTIQTFTFADISADAMPGFVYGDAGTVTNNNGNTMIDDTVTSLLHTSQSAAATWRYIADTNDLESDETQEIYASDYTSWFMGYLRANMCGQNSIGGDNGFMFMALLGESSQLARRFNAYFALPAVKTPAGVPVLDITMYQIYRKFNSDQCYVDYRTDNGSWKSWEINIRGIDVEVNDFASVRPVYTLPLELCQQDSIRLRFRWASTSRSGGAYGYYWAIDDVSILEGGSDRWRGYTENYPDGAYGMMPKNMKLPLAWFSNVSNTGSNARNDISTVVNVLDDQRSNPTAIITNSEGSLAAGAPSQQKQLTVDERGLFGSDESNTYWWGYSNVYNTTTVPQGYAYLPVDQSGARYVTVSATSNGVDPVEWDTIRYNVVEATGNDDDGTVFGYRWAHDNGLIANESRYDLQFVQDDDDETVFYWSYPSDDEEPHYTNTGYTLALRYTTGAEIPTDDEGNPWALLGIEIVPSTASEDWEGMYDVDIRPIVWNLIFNEAGDGANFYSVATGYSERGFYTVDADVDANFENMEYDHVLNGAGEIGADYNAVVIPFPGQPYLEPNLSYYLGYRMVSPGFFAAAQTRNGYYDDDDQYVRYREDETYKNQASQFAPYGMDVYLYDPVGNSSPYAAFTDNSYPMIRAIVGPRRDVPEHDITILCDPEGEADSLQFTILNFDQNYICDQRETFFEASATTYYVVPEGDHGYIDEIIIDGVHYNAERLAGDQISIDPEVNAFVSAQPYFVYDTIDGVVQTNLQRAYYVVYFEDIDADHDLSATAHWEPWHIGIDPVDNECVLAVMPNPASSQVKVNISGVSGMVNCNIIDMSGRVVYNSDFTAEQGETISLNNFARGAYFVRVTNGNFSKIEKLIVR